MSGILFPSSQEYAAAVQRQLQAQGLGGLASQIGFLGQGGLANPSCYSDVTPFPDKTLLLLEDDQ